MSRQRRFDEDGSLAVVLLAAIVLAGAVAALFITVDTGVDTARRDRDWHGAIQAADAGIQEAVTVIRGDEVLAACPDGVCSGALGDGSSYVANYEETELGYRVCSVGQSNGVEREACADFDLNMLFGGAGLIGLDGVTIIGAAPNITEPLVIGTAGVFNIGDQACHAIDGVEIYDPSEEDGLCGVTTDRTNRTFPNLAEEAFETGVCSGDAPIWQSYPNQPPDDDTRAPWVRGETYCARRIDLPRGQSDVVLSGPAGEAVRIYVDPGPDTSEGIVKIAGQRGVNAGGDPLELQVFVRRGGVELAPRGTPSVNAIWYAPESSCDLRGTPTYTGAVLCDWATLRGAVDFIVPDDLRTLRAGPTVLDRWYEP